MPGLDFCSDSYIEKGELHIIELEFAQGMPEQLERWFWKGRSDIDFCSNSYIEKGEQDIIELEFGQEMPEQLERCGFWKGMSDIDFCSDSYIEKGEHDIIELEFAQGMPEQLERWFWKGRSGIDFCSDSYIEKGGHDIIELEFAKGMPEQLESDCGIFTICFAEHFIFQKVAKIPNYFPVAQHRNKLCVNLYMHAMNKQLGGYVSNTEWPGRLDLNE